ncbi:MAG: 1-acyl-sn-glycerol-3-phosphate acyltransferase [Bacteroidales bacterium]|nr:1-acyl-sn-glycerol-3-phosphate acyltransferase [Bacteroidales bacterium]
MGKSTLKHLFFWRFAQATIATRLAFLFKMQVIWHKKPPKDGPFIVIANHANRGEPFLIGRNIKTPINYMANVDGVKGANKLFSSGLGCFNIKKGRPDTQAFVKAMDLLRNGYTVGIFVEGDRSWIGKTKDFSTATASLAKKMNVPILMARFSGSYMSRPRWSEIPRVGKIFLEFDRIDVEEVQRLSKEELQLRMFNYINNDDFTDERVKKIVYKGKDFAVGIENLLWKCPSCNSEDTLKGTKNEIVCKSCKTTFAIDGNQNVSDPKAVLNAKQIATVKDWNNWQIELAKKSFAQFPENTLLSDNEVELFDEPSENVWQSLGTGTLSLNNEGILWKSGNNELLFAKKDILNVVDNFNEYSLLNLKRSRYKFVSKNTVSYKWANLLEIVLNA